jgi:hypothetical protein
MKGDTSEGRGGMLCYLKIKAVEVNKYTNIFS